ncbi:sodium/chloride dependent amino acid transporter, putative [Ixodes scapularis]|uniref:Sodium-dependent nutrient amino acid transporter 1 n=1 Tax=Ixodes scapularis TaxID=6945 RepID=B7QL78_IXOSC|nr:sodium/chloride dependent amino acid transporter, putative [Ixodes scapularis]|eukprot:XP_002415933.1 sodium/chloride dependent amino acid transporter, putative [Ixodes scapularis]
MGTSGPWVHVQGISSRKSRHHSRHCVGTKLVIGGRRREAGCGFPETMGQRNAVLPLLLVDFHRPRQRLEVPHSRIPERRRCIPHSVLRGTVPHREARLLHGTRHRTIRIGVAQLFSTFYVTVSYNYIMALCLFYVFASMQSQLPWTHCDPEWSDSNCFDSRAANRSVLNSSSATSSAEQYFQYVSGNLSWFL